MKVLFFVSEFDRFNGGQRSLLQMVKNLPSVGITPIVVFPAMGKCSKSYEKSGVNIMIIKCSKPLMQFGQGLMRLSLFSTAYLFFFHVMPYGFRLANLMRKEKIKVLHCNTTRSLLIGATIPKILGKKIIWHVRGELKTIPRKLLAISEFLSSRIVLVAEALKNQIGHKNVRKCRVIYNAIDNDTFQSNSFGTIKNQQLTISTFAAITPFKGYHHLIDAIDLVNKKHPEDKISFKAIGEVFDQEYYRYLKDKIKELGITNIEFVGWTDKPELYYTKSDVVLLPTVQEDTLTINGVKRNFVTGEGLPRTILEAMYFKKPVIATKVAGTPEQIEHGKSGFIIEPNNSEQLAKAIIEIIEMGERKRLQMGEFGYKIVQSKFSNSTMLKSFTNLLSEIK